MLNLSYDPKTLVYSVKTSSQPYPPKNTEKKPRRVVFIGNVQLYGSGRDIEISYNSRNIYHCQVTIFGILVP